MKILFDIRKGTGGRTYAYSLNIQAVITVDGERMCTGHLSTINGIPSVRIHSIVKEFKETGCLTGSNLAFVKNGLHNKGLSIDDFNAKYKEF